MSERCERLLPSEAGREGPEVPPEGLLDLVRRAVAR